jgi:hypothetical protein
MRLRERDELGEAKDAKANIAPNFTASSPDGGHWEGRYFVWDLRTRSMSRDMSGVERQRHLHRRPSEDGDDA